MAIYLFSPYLPRPRVKPKIVCVPAQHQIVSKSSLSIDSGRRKSVATSDGKIHVLWLDKSVWRLTHSYSSDDGETWTHQNPLTTDEDNQTDAWDFHTDGSRLYLLYDQIYLLTADVRVRKTNTDSISWQSPTVLETFAVDRGVNYVSIWVVSVSEVHYWWDRKNDLFDTPRSLIHYRNTAEIVRTVPGSESDWAGFPLQGAVGEDGTPFAVWDEASTTKAGRKVGGSWESPTQIFNETGWISLVPRTTSGIFTAVSAGGTIRFREHDGTTWGGIVTASVPAGLSPYYITLLGGGTPRLAYADYVAGNTDLTRGWWIVNLDDIADVSKHTKTKRLNELVSSGTWVASEIYFFPPQRSEDEGWHGAVVADGTSSDELWHLRICEG